MGGGHSRAELLFRPPHRRTSAGPRFLRTPAVNTQRGKRGVSGEVIEWLEQSLGEVGWGML